MPTNRSMMSPFVSRLDEVQVEIDPGDLATFVDEYLEAALLMETGDDDRPLDRTYGIDDVGEDALAVARWQCLAFMAAAGDDLTQYQVATGRSGGGDFWLTRNGHGTGFWSRGLGPLGATLTELAHQFGETGLYVGDDGELYLS